MARIDLLRDEDDLRRWLGGGGDAAAKRPPLGIFAH
jgi:hypothetical protein